MRDFVPISARTILLAILALGLTNIALSLVYPDARFTILLGEHWQSLSLALILSFIVFRLISFALNKNKISSTDYDESGLVNYPVLSNDKFLERHDSIDAFQSARDTAMNTAATLPIPDAVYEIVSYNHWCSEPFKINPSELSWLSSLEQFEHWARRANKLRSAAYHVGDAGLRGDGTVNAARDNLIATNPGFSEFTYKRAISYGYQMAR